MSNYHHIPLKSFKAAIDLCLFMNSKHKSGMFNLILSLQDLQDWFKERCSFRCSL